MIEPTGYTALDLIGFTDRGAYDPTANYVKNDIVTVGNTKWRCKVDDTTGVTPAENANWTIYLESATSLAGMDDVDITTPTNGDLLQYNSADDEWVNSSDVWKTMAKNGAHNLLNFEGWLKSLNHSYTVNNDVYSLTTGSDLISAWAFSDKDIDFVLSGTITNTTTNNVRLEVLNSSNTVVATLNASTPSVSGTGCKIRVNWSSGGDFTISKPMIRLASDPNTDYTPYAPTNRDCMSYSVNTKLGAHNMLDSSVITQTINGIVFTVTRVGGFITEIDANGTVVDNNAQLFLRNRNSDYLELPVGSYIGSGCPTGGSDDTYHMRFIQTIDNQAVEFRDYGNGVEFNVTNVNHMGVTIYIKLGTIVNHKKFYPMIRLSTDTDPTFAPYAMTNRELTEKVSGYKILATASANQTFSAQMSTLYTAYNSLSTADKLLTEVWRDDNGGLGVFHLDVRGDAIFSNNYVASDGSTSMIRFLRLSTPLAWNIKIVPNGTVTTENINSATNTAKLILVKRSV